MVIYIPITPEGAQDVAAAISRSQLAHEGEVTMLSVFMQTGEVRAFPGRVRGRSRPCPPISSPSRPRWRWPGRFAMASGVDAILESRRDSIPGWRQRFGAW